MFALQIIITLAIIVIAIKLNNGYLCHLCDFLICMLIARNHFLTALLYFVVLHIAIEILHHFIRITPVYDDDDKGN